MVSLKAAGEIEGVRHFTGRDFEKTTVISGPDNSIWVYGSFRATMAANGKINSSKGRYENGFLYQIIQQ